MSSFLSSILNEIIIEASSYSSNWPPKKAIGGNTSYYWYSSSSDYNPWWQFISTSNLTIQSYIITTSSSFDIRPKKWIVNASLDNEKWEKVDERSGIETGGNTQYFVLSSPVKCKYFRIEFLQQHDSDRQVAMTNFDINATVIKNKKIRVECTNRRKSVSINITALLISLGILFFTKE